MAHYFIIYFNISSHYLKFVLQRQSSWNNFFCANFFFLNEPRKFDFNLILLNFFQDYNQENFVFKFLEAERNLIKIYPSHRLKISKCFWWIFRHNFSCFSDVNMIQKSIFLKPFLQFL